MKLLRIRWADVIPSICICYFAVIALVHCILPDVFPTCRTSQCIAMVELPHCMPGCGGSLDRAIHVYNTQYIPCTQWYLHSMKWKWKCIVVRAQAGVGRWTVQGPVDRLVTLLLSLTRENQFCHCGCFFNQKSKDQSTNTLLYCSHAFLWLVAPTKCRFLIGSKSWTPNTTPNLVSFSLSLASGLGNPATHNRTRTSQLTR